MIDDETYFENLMTDAVRLGGESDLIDVLPLGPRTVAVFFRCKGMVQHPDGSVAEAERFVVEIHLGEDHQRTKPAPTVMRLVHPSACFAPNIAPPLMCGGDLWRGISIVDLIYQAYELISWQNTSIREDDALNHAACQWARSHPDAYPIDTRPLKWRRPERAENEESRR